MATEDVVKLANKSGVPEIIEAVTGRKAEDRPIDQETYRQSRKDTERRVCSVSGGSADSFTKHFVDVNNGKTTGVTNGAQDAEAAAKKAASILEAAG